MARFAILGAGSWGTALGIMLARQDEHSAVLWEFRPGAAEQLIADRENREFLPGAPFPDSLIVTSDLDASLTDCDAVLVVVPSHVVRSVLERIEPETLADKVLIGASKGIEQDTLQRMSEVAAAVLGERVARRCVALSGPSHAEEVAKGIPTTVVSAAHDLDVARIVQHWLSCPAFRVYASDDITGVELGGSLKNIIALATGICDGLGYGDNTRGALMTRGLHEISRLGIALGGRRETFAGLSGMGDLITTCTSRHSRNRYVGEQLGRGRSLDDILRNMTMVAEGVTTTKAACALADEHDVEMPIAEQVHDILFAGRQAKEAVIQLMTRKLKVERHL
ncbi:MAG: Glycerol-3-phosphate dehydrogenase [NAD(P)+] [Calditrichaeota bacterium]|nr:Glycerol-3-phosphate dehydrogenase [NAD(P)+] [Calditrichota bacterium]